MKNIQIGIWLDFKEAYISKFNDGNLDIIKHLISKVTHPQVKGWHTLKNALGATVFPRR